jgi:hypothetical protein
MLRVARAQRRHIPRDMLLADLAERPDPLRGQRADVTLQITAVRGERVRRQPALDRQVVQIRGDNTLDTQAACPLPAAQASTSSSRTLSIPCASATGP